MVESAAKIPEAPGKCLPSLLVAICCHFLRGDQLEGEGRRGGRERREERREEERGEGREERRRERRGRGREEEEGGERGGGRGRAEVKA